LYWIRATSKHVGHAFTLVELLVVVAIIALLVSILLPALSHVRDQGKSAVCLSNIRSLGMALQTYLQSHEDRFPSYGYKHGGQSAAEHSWIESMADEYARQGGATLGKGGDTRLREEVDDVRRCPSDDSPHFRTARVEGDRGETVKVWRQTSYATNFYLVAQDPLYIFKERRFDTIDRIDRPSSTIWLAEMAEVGEYATADHVHPENWIYGDWRQVASEQLALERHAGRENYGFLDGHAEPLKFEKTYAPDPNSLPPDIEWFYNKYDPEIAR
jgi:prepilin-type N-terminal cleavage/methylation domain-containing protein/prepilin-type processing-associated H-X9-DG protein